MRLIGKSRCFQNLSQNFYALNKPLECLARTYFGAERGRGHPEHAAKSARKGFKSELVFLRPILQSSIGIFKQIRCEQIGPFLDQICRRYHLICEELSRGGGIRFGKFDECVHVGNAREIVSHCTQTGQCQIEDLGARDEDAIAMGIERAVQQDITGPHAKTAARSAFLQAARKDHRRIGFRVSVAGTRVLPVHVCRLFERCV